MFLLQWLLKHHRYLLQVRPKHSINNGFGNEIREAHSLHVFSGFCIDNVKPTTPKIII